MIREESRFYQNNKESEDGAIHFLANLLQYWLIVAESTKEPLGLIEAIQEGLSIPIKM